MSDKKRTRPLYLSFDPTVNGLQFVPTPQYLAYFGQNVGNLAFVYALSTQLRGEKTFYRNISLPPQRFSELADVLVFPAANNLAEGGDLGWLADIIEKSNLPILIAGLGVQSTLAKQKFALSPGTQRFIDLIKDRKIGLGVRGQYTAEFLSDFGVHTAVVTGCPSNFINPATDLGFRLQAKYERMKKLVGHSVAINLEYFRLDSARVQTIVNWAKQNNGSVVMQSDEAVFALMRGDYAGTDEKVKWIAKYFTGSTDRDSFEIWMAQYARLYCNVPAWMDYLRSISASVGSRFHGNMLAAQAETPAVVFPHDSRTLEMCETMKLPHVMWESITPETRLQDVFEQVSFDGAAYDKNRSELAKRYRDLVRDVGIELQGHVVEIAESGKLA